MYLILLLVVYAALGVFAVQNGGTHEFSYLGYRFDVPLWTPAVLGTGVVSALFLLYMSHAGVGYRLREFGRGRALDEHRAQIGELRDENARLREELAAVRGEVRGAARVSAAGGPAAPRRSLVDTFRAMTTGGSDHTTTT